MLAHPSTLHSFLGYGPYFLLVAPTFCPWHAEHFLTPRRTIFEHDSVAHEANCVARAGERKSSSPLSSSEAGEAEAGEEAEASEARASSAVGMIPCAAEEEEASKLLGGSDYLHKLLKPKVVVCK